MKVRPSVKPICEKCKIPSISRSRAEKLMKSGGQKCLPFLHSEGKEEKRVEWKIIQTSGGKHG